MSGPGSFSVAIFAFLLAVAPLANAHIQMSFPPPLLSIFNPATPQVDIDYSMTNPLLADGSNYPCKGYNTPANIAATDSVATLTGGTTLSVTLAGTATHNGGSCQFAVSYDGGNTMAVIASIVGGCPIGEAYTIDIPSDLPSAKKAIFSWQWENHTGNREMYQNCAVVDIEGSGASFTGPSVYRVNTFADGTCITGEGFDVVYPNPGPQVQYGGVITSSSPPTVVANCKQDFMGNVTVGPSASSYEFDESSQSTSETADTSLTEGAGPSQTISSTSSNIVITPATVTTSSSPSVQDIPGSTTSSSEAASSTSSSADPATGVRGSTYPSTATGLRCLSTTTFALCGSGQCTNMGPVADGTSCVGNAIIMGGSRRKRHQARRQGRGAFRLRRA